MQQNHAVHSHQRGVTINGDDCLYSECQNCTLRANNSIIIGESLTVYGNGNRFFGKFIQVHGHQNVGVGEHLQVTGNGNRIYGPMNRRLSGEDNQFFPVERPLSAQAGVPFTDRVYLDEDHDLVYRVLKSVDEAVPEVPSITPPPPPVPRMPSPEEHRAQVRARRREQAREYRQAKRERALREAREQAERREMLAVISAPNPVARVPQNPGSLRGAIVNLAMEQMRQIGAAHPVPPIARPAAYPVPPPPPALPRPANPIQAFFGGNNKRPRNDKPRVPEPEVNEPDALEGQTACSICLCKLVTTLVKPCRHACMCIGCSIQTCTPANSTCPVCRTPVKRVTRIFFSS